MHLGRAEHKMANEPKSGIRYVILVWIIGLTLGVAAGAATAMLLLPDAKKSAATAPRTTVPN